MAGESLWLDTVPPRPRKALQGDTETDVAIVGAGFTGLWTAYYLRRRAPELRVLVIEAEHVGFGASGRNGGWCTTEMPALLANLVRRYGPMPAMRMYRAGRRTLDEIGRVLAAEDIDCGWQRDGTLYVARSEPQRARLLAWQDMRLQLGITDLELLDPTAARTHADLPGVLEAGFTPHCAVVQPAAIAKGLADAVERHGGEIVEDTRVTDLGARRLVTDHGTVTAKTILVATEAYTGALPGHRRRVLPLYSRLIATAPLPIDTWAAMGFRDRVTVADNRYQFAYLQRTADDRLVLGGLGAGYPFASRAAARHDRDERIHARQRQTMAELFPQLSNTEITHRWGGAYGLHRDTEPAVVFDPATGLGHAGGYGGEGIALSNLAGRTMAALVTGQESPETRLCWVNHRGPRWEPEPLRFLGVRGVSALATRADRHEDRTGRTAPLAGVAMRAVL